MTVNELIEILAKFRDEGVNNGAGDRVIDGNSVVTLVNRHAPDDYWLVPLKDVDVDCYHDKGSWIVQLGVDRKFGKEESDRFAQWLDGERKDF